MGWGVLPEYQGQGIATRAADLALARARETGRQRFLHAFPSVDNAASNALCRKLGFELLGESDVEYPPGHIMRCNDWRFDLAAAVPE
jgi:RimJ/RimL family protein N-acetyltransferase